jgi:hypothetical protein
VLGCVPVPSWVWPATCVVELVFADVAPEMTLLVCDTAGPAEGLPITVTIVTLAALPWTAAACEPAFCAVPDVCPTAGPLPPEAVPLFPCSLPPAAVPPSPCCWPAVCAVVFAFPAVAFDAALFAWLITGLLPGLFTMIWMAMFVGACCTVAA